MLSKDRQEKTSFAARQKKFMRSRQAEVEYARKLRSIAKQVGNIVHGFTVRGKVTHREELDKALRDYSEMIKPWAKAVAQKMLDELQSKDEAMWHEMGSEMGRNLRREIQFARTGSLMQEALTAQVSLITSIPLEAAQRVNELTLAGIADSTRASEIAEMIMATEEVTRSRATLIARTEVARTSTELTKARSEIAGVTHYIWRTAGDSDVRHSHKEMNGKIIPFAKEPEVEPGKFYHAGCFPNCRCYAEPIVPDE